MKYYNLPRMFTHANIHHAQKTKHTKLNYMLNKSYPPTIYLKPSLIFLYIYTFHFSPMGLTLGVASPPVKPPRTWRSTSVPYASARCPKPSIRGTSKLRNEATTVTSTSVRVDSPCFWKGRGFTTWRDLMDGSLSRKKLV